MVNATGCHAGVRGARPTLVAKEQNVFSRPPVKIQAATFYLLKFVSREDTYEENQRAFFFFVSNRIWVTRILTNKQRRTLIKRYYSFIIHYHLSQALER